MLHSSLGVNHQVSHPPCGHRECPQFDRFCREAKSCFLFPHVKRSSHLGNHLHSFLNPQHLHHLISEMVDDLDRYTAGLGANEGARHGAFQAVPGFLVDLSLQGRL